MVAIIPEMTSGDAEYESYLDDSRQHNSIEVVNTQKRKVTLPQRMETPPDILRSLSRLGRSDVRSKPLYSDCWVLGDRDDIEIAENYLIPLGEVVVGNAFDGQMEYHLIPYEHIFDDATNAMISETIEAIRNDVSKGVIGPDRRNILSRSRCILMEKMRHLRSLTETEDLDDRLERLAETVCRHSVGLGVFEVLLSDPHLEDIFIDAPCDRNRIHVTLNGMNGYNSHIRCRTNLMVDAREVKNLIYSLKRDSGLNFSESSPILETDMRTYDARATVIGYPMSPKGDAVAIRKHSRDPWTLTRMIFNHTLEPIAAGLLSFLVDMRSTFLISGARGAGKSSLLAAMMFEFPLSQRILTIEDTMELPCEKMREMGYKVQSMLIDDRMDGDALKRSDEALRVSLRLGESAIVLGEVRGEEARTLYQSMRAGRAGSSIMGTIHGDSAKSVYERVVHDLQIPPEAFMATDVIVTMGTDRARGSSKQVRKLMDVSALSDKPGEFVPLIRDGELSEEMFDAPVIRRIMMSSSMTKDDVISDIRMRSEIRMFLAGTQVVPNGCGSEWISAANEFVSRELAAGRKDTDGIANDFRMWFGRYNGVQ